MHSSLLLHRRTVAGNLLPGINGVNFYVYLSVSVTINILHKYNGIIGAEKMNWNKIKICITEPQFGFE